MDTFPTDVVVSPPLTIVVMDPVNSVGVAQPGVAGPPGPPGPPGPSVDAYTKAESDVRFAPMATISSDPPSGGQDGDVWYQLT